MSLDPSALELVGKASPADLLPQRFTAEGAAIPLSLTIRAATKLGDSAYLLVMQGDELIVVVPTVIERGKARRAVAGDGAAEALLARIASDVEEPLPNFVCERFPQARIAFTERALPVDQTHDSVVVGEQAVVKWQVKAAQTPAAKLIAHLTANGFVKMPRPWAFVSWKDQNEVLVASVTDFLPGASDGWDWLVDDVASFATGKTSLAAVLAPAADLGDLVAELHVAMASPSRTIAQPIRVASQAEVKDWYQRANSFLSEALSVVEGSTHDVLRAREAAIVASLSAILEASGTVVIPVHGDLHVGQLLRWQGGYAVNDFDGNPVLPPAERLNPQPAARDVAGMLQSLDHVGRIVVRHTVGGEPQRVWQWVEESQKTFLAAYRTRLKQEAHSHLLDDNLLLPFRAEQECREFIYAHSHLPRWRYVPEGAVQSLFP